MEYIVILAVTLFVFLLLFKEYISIKKIKDADLRAFKIIDDAKKRSESLLKEAHLEAKDRLFKMKIDFDVEVRETKSELKKLERRLINKEEILDRKHNQLEKREVSLLKNEKDLSKKIEELNASQEEYMFLITKKQEELERISTLTKEEAKDFLIRSMEIEARHEGAKAVRRIENECKEDANRKAKEIISTAIQRCAGDFVAERTVSVVHLPGDDMKGRIIGREGRNIRAIEASTGVDLIIDDTPEAVILSSFNPVRREIARLALMKLISDGRIHPARIEDVVRKVKDDLEHIIKEAGEQAAFDLGVHGISSELIKKLGALKYRTSYSQNVLQHSIEVGILCGIMAAELGLKTKLARRMGLLHDIGKSIDHEIEGPHAIIGASLAKKFGESEEVIHGIEAHHEDIPINSVYATLVQAADSLSGARPGARKELLENYVKRLEELENIAISFKGVAQSFAIQAGREVRVVVESDVVSDDEAILLSKDIAKKIEEDLVFPGQIKVMVVRETRAVEFANK